MKTVGTYYCPYCNNRKLTSNSGLDEPTDEHFIPRSIGGAWTIKVCKNCNKVADRVCDRIMKQVGYTYEISLRGMLIREGIAELTTGQEIPVLFKYQTTQGGHHQFFWCRERQSNIELPRNLVRRVFIPVMDKREVLETFPAVCKIALGAMYYLVRRNRLWTREVRKVFEGLSFADLRSRFLAGFRPGGSGRGHGAIATTLRAAEAAEWLRESDSPSIRQHIVCVQDSVVGVIVSLCLFSTFFWRITIPGVELGTGKLQLRKSLPQLRSVEPAHATALMYNEGRDLISIAVSDQVDTVISPDEAAD